MIARGQGGEHRKLALNAAVEEALNLAYHGARAEKKGFNITLEHALDPTAGQVDRTPEVHERVATAEVRQVQDVGEVVGKRLVAISRKIDRARGDAGIFDRRAHRGIGEAGCPPDVVLRGEGTREWERDRAVHELGSDDPFSFQPQAVAHCTRTGSYPTGPYRPLCGPCVLPVGAECLSPLMTA